MIDKISIDNYKNDYISLQLNVDPLDNNYEILVLSAVDLVSRLSVNTVRPKFAHNIATTLSKTKRNSLKAHLILINSRLDTITPVSLKSIQRLKVCISPMEL